MDKLKVAVIGCGLIAQMRHIPALLRMKRKVEFCAVCDLNAELVEETASKFNIPHAFTDSTAMFAQEDLDLADICVPPQIHAPIALEAMAHGCNVIMEKPMALTTLDCDKMIAASQERRVKVSVIHNQLFHAPLVRARQLVDSGAIGDFHGMRIFISTPRSDMIDLKDHWYHKLPGGVIGETGPHMSYISSAFLGRIDNVDVRAKSYLNLPWAPFDEFRFEIEGERGFSSVTISYANDYWASQIDLFGSTATLRVDLPRMLLLSERVGSLGYASVGRASLSNIAQMVKGLASNSLKAVAGIHKLGTDAVIEQFVDSVLYNYALPVTAEEGREAVRIMEAIVARYNEKY